MARPRLAETKQQITFSIDPELLEAINQKRKHRPLSQQIREDLYNIYDL